MKKLLIVGHGRSGKDTACEYLEKLTLLKNAGTTSVYLAEHVAKKLGLSVEEAYKRRHESDEMRQIWYKTGNEVRKNGPTTLIKQALENGDITGGIRDYQEIVAAKEENLFDLIIWIENKNVKKDPTLHIQSKDCDIIIENDYTDEFYKKLYRLAKFSELPLR